jgi:hypothetical protein
VRLSVGQDLRMRLLRGVHVLSLRWGRQLPLHIRHGTISQRGTARVRQVTDAGALAQEVIVGKEIMEQGSVVPCHAHELSHTRWRWHDLQELPGVLACGIRKAKRELAVQRAR